MSVENNHLDKDVTPVEAAPNGTSPVAQQLTHEEVAQAAARFGYGPLAHVNTADNQLRPFGGEFQPGLYRSVQERKFANPAPLGLSAFALTTFVLSLINMKTRDISEPSIVIGLAFGYGGLVQLCAGMWEMAVGNTFGATALSSYGGFWIAFAIVLTPGGFEIEKTLGQTPELLNSLGLFLMGWFIFTFLMLIATLRSTVAFFLLFLFLDITFLLLGLAYLLPVGGKPSSNLQMSGGFFGLLAAFAAWYNALAGILDDSNSFFVIPVAHFPWSPTGRSNRNKTARETV